MRAIVFVYKKYLTNTKKYVMLIIAMDIKLQFGIIMLGGILFFFSLVFIAPRAFILEWQL